MGLFIPTECSLPASECGWRWSGWVTSWSGQRDCLTPTTSQSWSCSFISTNISDLHGQWSNRRRSKTLGARHSSRVLAWTCRPTHCLHKGGHRRLKMVLKCGKSYVTVGFALVEHIWYNLGCGECVAEERDNVGDIGKVEAAGACRGGKQELVVQLQGRREREGEPQVLSERLLSQVNVDPCRRHHLHTVRTGGVWQRKRLLLPVHRVQSQHWQEVGGGVLLDWSRDEL